MIVILLFLIGHWYLSLFMQTFLQHRYAAHGAFSMRKGWERFFYIGAYLTQGSSYVSPRVYAIMHRMHHAFTDTDQDPHSPSYDKNLFTMMWRTRKMTNDIFRGKQPIEAKFTRNLPDWMSLDNLGHSTWSRMGWIALYVTFYVIFAPSAWWFLLVPIHILMVPIQGAIINWYAHKYGSVNFKMKNTSTNLFPVDLLMMGEAYHNNHHKNPSSAKFGHRKYELDPTYQIMRLLNRLRIIKIKNSAPTP